MDAKTVVVNKEGLMGVVINDSFGCCSSNEVPVVYEGSSTFCGTDIRELKIIGPENAQADMKKCGAGEGEECCIFMSIGPEGPMCERFGGLRFTLMARRNSMNAKREPTQLFPNCQL